MVGDAGKAKQRLSWQPKTGFRELARLMVDADVAMLKDARRDPARARL